MISWNKKRKIFLIVGSGVWIFFLIVLSIYLYPEKRGIVAKKICKIF